MKNDRPSGSSSLISRGRGYLRRLLLIITLVAAWILMYTVHLSTRTSDGTQAVPPYTTNSLSSNKTSLQLFPVKDIPKEPDVPHPTFLDDSISHAANELRPHINKRVGRTSSYHQGGSCPSRDPPNGYENGLANLNDRVSWENGTEVTSAEQTSFVVVASDTQFHVCDQMQIKIQARDYLGRRKTYGGDFFRAKLYHHETRAYVNADYIIDSKNGTYDIYFTLRWPGATEIDVMLVHPSEAVSVIKRITETMPNRLVYTGRYVHPNDNSINETKLCDVTVPKEPFCNYSEPHVFAPWYCIKPTNRKVSCRHLTEVCNTDGLAKKRMYDVTTEVERQTFAVRKIPLTHNGSSFTVSENGRSRPTPLPYCNLTTIPKDMIPNGYFIKDTWNPFNCKLKKLKEEQKMQCLKDTRIYILGDSTIRQFFGHFCSMGGFKLGPGGSPLKVGPRVSHNAQYNIWVKFHFHGLPLGIHCNPWKELYYAFNEIHKIEGGHKTIVFISLWAHLQKTSFQFYEKRVEAILASLERLLQRSPDTTIIFKGGNTRYTGSWFWAICSSDWIAYQFEIKLRQILSKSRLKIGFLDAWDLTNAHHSRDFIHPGKVIVDTMFDQFFTHYCL